MNKKKFLIIAGMLTLELSILSITLFCLSSRTGEYRSMQQTMGTLYSLQKEQESVPVSGEDQITEKVDDHSKLKKENEVSSSQFTDSNPVRILFLGIDRTEERDITIGAHRTDIIALASIYQQSKKIEILRIPRDTYVYIPVINKMDKINHAYVWGGMGEKGIQSTIETVNQFVKYTKADNYFAIDMEPVPDIIDKLGGVEIEVDVDMHTHGFNLSRGFQHLDGEKAYQFISWRYSGEGEIDRIRRQQILFEAMLLKLKENKSLITSIEIIMKYHKNIKTNLNIQQLFNLAKLADGIEAVNIEYAIIPGEGRIIDGVWYMVDDKEKTEIILKDFYQ